MRTKFLSLLVSLLAWGFTSYAIEDDRGTNDAFGLLYDRPLGDVLTEGPPENILMAIERNIEDNPYAESRFGPLTHANWSRLQNRKGYGSLGNWNDTGQKTFRSTIGFSILDALADELKFDRFGFFRTPVGAFVDNLIIGSIGNNEERILDFVSSSPTYIDYRNWWDNVETPFGVRQNYIYAMQNFGHSMGKPIMHVDLRAIALLQSLNPLFYEQLVKMEALMVFPIMPRCQLKLAASAYPAVMLGQTDLEAHPGYAPEASARLEYLLDKKRNDGVIWAGVKTTKIENMFMAGVSLKF